jgi:hypothetical protein
LVVIDSVRPTEKLKNDTQGILATLKETAGAIVYLGVKSEYKLGRAIPSEKVDSRSTVFAALT